MTQTDTQKIADKILDANWPWDEGSDSDVLRDAIDAALIAYGNARIEEAAKVADDRAVTHVRLHHQHDTYDDKLFAKAAMNIASAIRSLATKEAT